MHAYMHMQQPHRWAFLTIQYSNEMEGNKKLSLEKNNGCNLCAVRFTELGNQTLV